MATETDLARECARFYADPLGFVMWAYPWDEDSGLQMVRLPEPYSWLYACEYGPDLWACDLLTHIGREVTIRGFDGLRAVEPLQYAVSSGHGIGKSTLTAWIVDWVMSTRPHARGTVTANTAAQLTSKTWAEIAKWTRKCATGHWFEIATGRGSMHMTHRRAPESWRVDAQTCREENSEAFAGMHAANSTPFYIFDEASAVPDKIHEVAQGGLTDGEPMMFAFGNPTRNTGWFADAFGGRRHRWNTRQIDSRSVSITNKDLLGRWVADEGEDSDFVRVRVRGIFPRASFNQFIGRDVVDGAAKRAVDQGSMAGATAVVGVDVARFGTAQSAIVTRIGRDARVVAAKRFRQMDTMQLASQVASHVDGLRAQGLRVVVFVDGGGVGGGVVDRLRQLGYDVTEVQFGGAADEPRKYANKRTEMWARAREWLTGGAITADEELATDLTAPEYTFTKDDRIALEQKERMVERGLASPDWGDALALTFAHPVNELPPQRDVTGRIRPARVPDYDPLA